MASAEGLETGPDAGILVADDPVELAERIVEVYTDDVLWRRLSRGGQASIERNCSQSVARAVFELLLAPAEASRPGAALVVPSPLHEA